MESTNDENILAFYFLIYESLLAQNVETRNIPANVPACHVPTPNISVVGIDDPAHRIVHVSIRRRMLEA